jgi:hypothetical protein
VVVPPTAAKRVSRLERAAREVAARRQLGQRAGDVVGVEALPDAGKRTRRPQLGRRRRENRPAPFAEVGAQLAQASSAPGRPGSADCKGRPTEVIEAAQSDRGRVPRSDCEEDSRAVEAVQVGSRACGALRSTCLRTVPNRSGQRRRPGKRARPAELYGIYSAVTRRRLLAARTTSLSLA